MAWTHVEPYFKLRDLLEPNTGGGYWNVPSGDCYVGLMPRWYVTVWGHHYEDTSLFHDGASGRSTTKNPDHRPQFVNSLCARSASLTY